MNEFWSGFYQFCEWLLILTGIGFFAVIFYIATTALAVKNSVMRNAKRLYLPPLNSVKSLAATGKGVAMQEKVRVLSIAGHFKGMAVMSRTPLCKSPQRRKPFIQKNSKTLLRMPKVRFGSPPR